MAFNGTEGNPIPIGEAADLTKRFREQNPEQIKASFLGRDLIEQALKQDGAMGLRIYYGLDENNLMQPVIVAAQADENDMLELIIDNTAPCPTRCSSANPLNTD